MKTRVFHFDVFTSQPGKGNAAGIVLMSDHLDSQAMQLIAASTGFNDTAFIVASQNAHFGIRYFSPRREVDLCGHATIAAATALWTGGYLEEASEIQFSLETKAGILPIGIHPRTDAALIIMSQTPSQFRPFNADRALLATALDVAETEFHPTLPIVYGSTGRWTLAVPVRSRTVLSSMQPKTEMFATVLVDMPEASIHPFCLEDARTGVHMRARHFSSPSSGTIEDAVTGTASGVLGAYYQEFVTNPSVVSTPIVVEQGYEVGREGRVLVWAEKRSDGYAVRIGGSAVLAGELLC